ncbi:transposase [Trujillonella humicola]|uniref:transposase n=1 Tax=Trujillonella humicola TaxID=3383699 RepID=UPI003905883C
MRQWREAFLAYFDTGRASNDGTEAVNGLIDLHRRVARAFRKRENYRLRMLLIAGGLTSPTSSKKSRRRPYLSASTQPVRSSRWCGTMLNGSGATTVSGARWRSDAAHQENVLPESTRKS